MIWLYRYFYGRLRVFFYGEFPERILSFCASNGISLWDSKSENEGITAYITVKDFYSLPEILKHSGIRVHIKEKSGFPFFVYRYKKRPGIIAGILLFIAFLHFMSGFIWIIEVKGNERVKYEEIIETLEKIGIYEGIASNKITPKTDRERLLLEMDTLAWVSLNIEGSRLTVNVSETEKRPSEENKPCNLKAEFDGIIKKIDLTSGNCVCKVGDTVKKGDVLVSGIIETVGGTRFVKSAGEVIAEVTQSFTLSEPYEKTEVLKTGKTEKRYVLEFFKIKLPLFLGAVTEPYEEELSVNDLKLFGVKLPIRLYEKEFRFVKDVTVKRDSEQLEKLLNKRIEELLKEKEITDYIIKSKEFKETETGINLELTVITEQNIAYNDFLLISTGN